MKVEVKEVNLKLNKRNEAYIMFKAELRNDDGELGATINGCRISNGNLMGPFTIAGGRPFPVVKFFGLEPMVLGAVKAAGWSRDFPRVRFPDAAIHEAVQ